ncbi:DUF3293 domain-containing protein [Tahibacter amnicola]|uniref:DUF3293 domain-containing protein n=1 Tax=Tahibacter amnicola TaxID=2976241 RepID=A0ABY6BCV1_9GAMM|nr:DUF3293 domain-containing protein [Tahibacter amnicola]UXI67033.1 DUF3293 domain-containing protein [Tahibacter amnicola]
MIDPVLLAAYRATDYDVRLPGGQRCRLKVDQAPPEPFRRWLGDAGFAFITAHNPGSVPLPAMQNRLHQHALLADLRQAGARVLAGVGRLATMGWREPSLVAAGLTLEHIDGLARRYGQNAVVTGHADLPLQLRLYTDPTGP